MDKTKHKQRKQPEVLRTLESPAYITAEQQLVDVVNLQKANIQVEVNTVVIDLKRQLLLIQPAFTYRGPKSEAVPLQANTPLVAISLQGIGDSAFDLCEKLVDIGLEHTLENLVEGKVFGIESMDDYIKE